MIYQQNLKIAQSKWNSVMMSNQKLRHQTSLHLLPLNKKDLSKLSSLNLKVYYRRNSASWVEEDQWEWPAERIITQKLSW